MPIGVIPGMPAGTESPSTRAQRCLHGPECAEDLIQDVVDHLACGLDDGARRGKVEHRIDGCVPILTLIRASVAAGLRFSSRLQAEADGLDGGIAGQ